MNYGTLGILFFGLAITLMGGSILFSTRALNWMYKEGIWKISPSFGEKKDKQLRRAGGGMLFFGGLVVIIVSIIGLFLG